MTAIRPANEPSIWVGFKNKFYALNPPLKMNFSTDEKLVKDVDKNTPCVLEKVNVTVVEISAPGFMFFAGSKILQLKEGSRTCSYSISYLNERPLIYQNGFSNWAFIYLAKDFNTTIENYCLDIVNTYGWVSLKEHLAKS